MDVSVVVPTFNRRTFISRALTSVLAQSQPAKEVIVIDDGSTDGTAAFLQQQFPSVTCVRQPNSGVSAARNHGIRLASCPWIAFLDSDDAWLPHKLERQQQALMDSRLGLCHSNELWIRNGKQVKQPKTLTRPQGDAFLACVERCCIAPSSVVIRRSLLDEVGGFDEDLPAAEDYDLWLRISQHHPVCFVDEPLLIRYGGHADQLSAGWGLDRFRCLALAKLLAEGLLDSQRAQVVRDQLKQKLHVVLEGANKRGNQQVVQQFTALRERLSQPE